MIWQNRWTKFVVSMAAILVLIPAFVFAGGYLIVSNTGVPFAWSTATPVPRDIDGGNFGFLMGGAPGAPAVLFAEAAIDIWDNSNEPTLALSFLTTSVAVPSIRPVP